MAEIEITRSFEQGGVSDTQPVVIEQTSGITDPQQYVLNSALLILNDGTAIELKPIIIEISIYEDIFSPTLNGYIMVTDSQGFIESYNITGFCFLQLSINKLNVDEPKPINKTFRVYKIGERFQRSRQNEEYPIHFCSEELIMSEQQKIAKSYRNTPISEIITSILKDELSVSKSLSIEKTKGFTDKIVPNLKPFEAINWLSTYAQPESIGGKSADMLFYENMDGFNFRSLQSLMGEKTYQIYNYSPQNVEKSSDINYNFSSILSFKFVNTFDALKTINGGGYANKIITIDPLLRTSKSVTFDYDDYFATSKTLNNYPINNGYVNRNNVNTSKSYNAVFKVATGNADQRENSSIASATGGEFKSITYDIGIETYVPYRTAQLTLLNHTKIEMSVPGDPNLSVGKVVILNLPSYSPQLNPKENQLDKYYAAKYLVTAVRHKFNINGIYQCIVEAVTDSVANPYTTYGTGNADTVK